MIFCKDSWRRDVGPDGAGKRHPAGRRQSAFTLLELMVALAILAIALSAVMRAVGAATTNVERVASAYPGRLGSR